MEAGGSWVLFGMKAAKLVARSELRATTFDPSTVLGAPTPERSGALLRRSGFAKAMQAPQGLAKAQEPQGDLGA